MIKLIFFLTIIFSSVSIAKQCYSIQHKKICYQRYFKISNINKPTLHTKYYKNIDGEIYSFENNIDLRFKRIGAILIIEDDFNIKFIDKNKKETYLYQVINQNELFSIITNLNNSTYISIAKPIRHRILTKLEYKTLQNAKRASMERRLGNYKTPKEQIQERAKKERDRTEAQKKKKAKETSNLKKGVESDLMW